MAEKKLIDRIMALLNKANDKGTTEAERLAYIAKAQELKNKHRIEESELRQNNPQRIEPIKREMPFPNDWEISVACLRMATALSLVVGVRVTVNSARVFEDSTMYTVGYPEDIQFFQAVWSSIYMSLTEKINPVYDEDKSEIDNLIVFYEAGLEPWVIASEFGYTDKYSKSVHAELRARYRTVMKERGLTPLDGRLLRNKSLYRESFIEGFRKAVTDRLLAQREANQQEVNGTPGAELAILSDEQRVWAKFYQEFPERAPEVIKRRRQAEQAHREEQQRRYYEWYQNLTPSAQRAEDIRMERAKAKAEREDRKFYDYRRKVDKNIGAENGRDAGSKVDLSGGRNRVQTRKELA